MDYGQTTQSNPVDQPADNFFTTGNGTNENIFNGDNPENNLDLSSEGSASWGQTPERNPRAIGSEVIASTSERDVINSKYQNETPEQTMKPEMPPGYPEITELSGTPEETKTDQDTIMDFSTIKEKNSFISKETLEATTKAVHKYEKGEISPAELSDLKWDATKAYLKNSFEREIAA